MNLITTEVMQVLFGLLKEHFAKNPSMTFYGFPIVKIDSEYCYVTVIIDKESEYYDTFDFYNRGVELGIMLRWLVNAVGHTKLPLLFQTFDYKDVTQIVYRLDSTHISTCWDIKHFVHPNEDDEGFNICITRPILKSTHQEARLEMLNMAKWHIQLVSALAKENYPSAAMIEFNIFDLIPCFHTDYGV